MIFAHHIHAFLSICDCSVSFFHYLSHFFLSNNHSIGSYYPLEQGEDERYDLTLDFIEAVFGTEKEIEILRLESCGACEGSGVKAGTSPSTCRVCGGSGQMVQTVRTPLGNFQQVSTCTNCGGSGQTFTACGTCGGDGRVRGSKTISLRIPAGVDTGSRLRVRGEGNAGPKGGPSGSLYVNIKVRADPELMRDGENIKSTVRIPYYDAILGTSVKVNTVDGLVNLRIPNGTQPETVLLMAKKGVPRLGNDTQRGDHLVTVKVDIPSRLNKEETELISTIKKNRDETLNAMPSGWKR